MDGTNSRRFAFYCNRKFTLQSRSFPIGEKSLRGTLGYTHCGTVPPFPFWESCSKTTNGCQNLWHTAGFQCTIARVTFRVECSVSYSTLKCSFAPRILTTLNALWYGSRYDLSWQRKYCLLGIALDYIMNYYTRRKVFAKCDNEIVSLVTKFKFKSLLKRAGLWTYVLLGILWPKNQ